MKRILALALAGALLAGCASHPQVRLDAGKALAGAELAVTGANVTAKAAADSGVCKGECAAKTRTALAAANACVGSAYAAYKANDLAATASTLVTCFAQIAEAKTTMEAH